MRSQIWTYPFASPKTSHFVYNTFISFLFVQGDESIFCFCFLFPPSFYYLRRCGEDVGFTPIRPYAYLPVKDLKEFSNYFKIIYVLHKHILNFFDYLWILLFLLFCLIVWLMVFNALFNNISAIYWRSVLVVEETGGPDEHRPVTRHWQTSSHYVVHLALNKNNISLKLSMNSKTKFSKQI